MDGRTQVNLVPNIALLAFIHENPKPDGLNGWLEGFVFENAVEKLS